MPTLSDMKILIADDNANNREVLKHILKQAGVRVTAVSEASAVLPALSSAFASQAPFDLAIIDICMPHMTGYEVARQIRAEKSRVAEIALLAYSSSVEHGSAKSIDAGFNGFLIKPASRQKLLELAGKLIGANSTGQANKLGASSSEDVSREPQADVNNGKRILLAEDNPANLSHDTRAHQGGISGGCGPQRTRSRGKIYQLTRSLRFDPHGRSDAGNGWFKGDKSH